jgi:CMP/dCMP kinase
MKKGRTIIINGLSGSGSTTAAKALARKLGYEHVYAGGIFRELAKEAGQSIEGFLKALENDPDRERAIDDNLMERAKQGSLVVESRVLPWLVPKEEEYFKVWLTCDFDERVRRLHQRESHRERADAKRHISERDGMDINRYRKVYGVDLNDLSVFDLVVDTTNDSPETVQGRILGKFRGRN